MHSATCTVSLSPIWFPSPESGRPGGCPDFLFGYHIISSPLRKPFCPSPRGDISPRNWALTRKSRAARGTPAAVISQQPVPCGPATEQPAFRLGVIGNHCPLSPPPHGAGECSKPNHISFSPDMLQALSPTTRFPSARTFVFLLELLVAGPLPEIGEDLRQFADDNVIGGQRGLCLKEKYPRNCLTPLTGNPLLARPALANSDQCGEATWMIAEYLHGGAVSLAPDQRRWDIGVGILIVQIYHIGHPPWQEQLIPLVGLVLEQNAVDVATWRGRKHVGELLLQEQWTSSQ